MQPTVAMEINDLDGLDLRYVSDLEPGITRRRHGRGFSYRHATGRAVHHEPTLARIKAVAVPPGWTDVWICPDDDGHIQATGRDERGRKQYRYHPRWQELRNQDKFDQLVEMGAALPAIRARMADDLRQRGIPRDKVLATVVRLLESTLVRVGNEEYARTNQSYGLTTMRDRHARITRGRVRFVFKGKSGQEHEVEVDDPLLARIVKQCQDIPGQQLFQYLDQDGARQVVQSKDVNLYLRDASGVDVTAKVFRTWMGTLLAASMLATLPPPKSERLAKKRVTSVISVVAGELANTPAVCRSGYVHPGVVDAYLDGSLPARWAAGPARQAKRMLAQERKLLHFLRAERRSAAKAVKAAA